MFPFFGDWEITIPGTHVDTQPHHYIIFFKRQASPVSSAPTGTSIYLTIHFHGNIIRKADLGLPSHSGSLSPGRARAPGGLVWPLCPGPRNGEILLRVPVSGFLSGFQKPEGEQDIVQTLVKFCKKANNTLIPSLLPVAFSQCWASPLFLP